jgi:hypothetical protein
LDRSSGARSTCAGLNGTHCCPLRSVAARRRAARNTFPQFPASSRDHFHRQE